MRWLLLLFIATSAICYPSSKFRFNHWSASGLLQFDINLDENSEDDAVKTTFFPNATYPNTPYQNGTYSDAATYPNDANPNNEVVIPNKSEHKKEPIITKYFYHHSAPQEEPEEAIENNNQSLQKHINYKVVFIKTPSPLSKGSIRSLVSTRPHEKTVIYVLSKKEDVNDFVQKINNLPVDLNKPEVHFVRYKTPEEADYAQKSIQDKFSSLGGTPINISNEGTPKVLFANEF